MPPPSLLLLLWMQVGAEATAAEVGLKPTPGVGEGEEEADDRGELGSDTAWELEA